MGATRSYLLWLKRWDLQKKASQVVVRKIAFSTHHD
jgi:hypothetical protein